MLSRNTRKGVLAAALIAGLALHQPAVARDPNRDHDNDDAKAAAAIAGVAIVGALAVAASNKRRDRDRSWERYERDDRYYYRNDWGATFRPSGTDHTICYRRTRQCYTKGQYSRKWTQREFGYYGR